jgi:hypothetical protein
MAAWAGRPDFEEALEDLTGTPPYSTKSKQVN